MIDITNINGSKGIIERIGIKELYSRVMLAKIGLLLWQQTQNSIAPTAHILQREIQVYKCILFNLVPISDLRLHHLS